MTDDELLDDMERQIEDLQRQAASVPQRWEDGSQRLRWGLAKVTDTTSSQGAGGGARVYGIRYISGTFDESVGFQDLVASELHSDNLHGAIAESCLQLDDGAPVLVLELNGRRWLVPWCPTVQGGGGPLTGFVTTRSLEPVALTIQWSADYGTTTYGIGASAVTVAFVGGFRLDDGSGGFFTGRVYDAAGALTGVEVDLARFRQNDCVADSSGNLYGSVQAVGAAGTLAKWNSAGVEQWLNTDAPYSGIAVDSAGNVYTSSANAPTSHIHKYNSAGVFQWSWPTPGGAATLNAIAVEAGDTFVIAVGDDSKVYKVTSAGVLSATATATSGEPLYAVAIDSSDNVFVGGLSGNSSSIEKFNSSLASQNTRDTGGTVFGVIAVGTEPYICGDFTGGENLQLLDATLATKSAGFTHGGTLRALALSATGNIVATGNRVAN